MATLKYRLNRKNSSGSYDTIHYETSSNIVLRPSGRTVEQDLEAYLPRTQSTDDVPQSLTTGQISVANNKVFCKLGSGITKDLSADTIIQVVDNLTSTSTTAALSAAQGRALNEKINSTSYAPVFGEHDMRNYDNGDSFTVYIGFTARIIIYYVTWRYSIRIIGNASRIQYIKSDVMERSLVYAAFP